MINFGWRTIIHYQRTAAPGQSWVDFIVHYTAMLADNDNFSNDNVLYQIQYFLQFYFLVYIDDNQKGLRE